MVAGLGRKVNTGPGDVDLDASALVLGVDGRILSDEHFVFFNNRATPDSAVRHTGDNRTGEGEGGDELTEGGRDETAMVFGQLYRRDGEWKFRAIGQGHASGLLGIAKDCGVDV